MSGDASVQSHCGQHELIASNIWTRAIQRLDAAVDRNHPAERSPSGGLSPVLLFPVGALHGRLRLGYLHLLVYEGVGKKTLILKAVT